MDKIRNVDRQKSVRRYPLTVVDPRFVEEIVKDWIATKKGNMEKAERESECCNPDLKLCFTNQNFRRII